MLRVGGCLGPEAKRRRSSWPSREWPTRAAPAGAGMGRRRIAAGSRRNPGRRSSTACRAGGVTRSAASGKQPPFTGGSHKGPFGPKIAGRTRALNSSSVRYRSAPPEQAVASWSSADRSSGRSGTGGSAAAQRLTATCAAAATAPARTCGYISCSTFTPVLAAIASARTSCIAELIFRYSPRMAGAVRTSLRLASHSRSGAWSAPS